MGVGNPWLRDDGVGPWLARRAFRAGWTGLDCGFAPENFTGRVRAVAPARLVIVDAASMGLIPGALRRVRAEDLAASAVTGHRLPWPLLAGYLRQICPDLTLVAVEPGRVVPGTLGLSPPVARAARRLLRLLARDRLEAIPLYRPG
ncbi:MAG: hydrogenase maturation protease [Moorellales bacterium]